MKRRVIFVLMMASAVALLVSCDAKFSVKDPTSSYFVKYFGGDGNQKAVDLLVNTDGTFFILGNSRAADDSVQKVYLAKADAKGNVIWQKTFNSTVDEEARDFALMGSGSLAIVANRYAGTGQSVMVLRIVDFSGGALSATKIYKDTTGLPSYANYVGPTGDGGLFLAGHSNDASKQYSLITRLNADLSKNINWELSPGKSPGTFNTIVSVFPNSPNFYNFGSSNQTSGGTPTIKFFAFPVGPDAGGTNKSGDDFFPKPTTADNLMTCAIEAASGGYLLTGISTQGQVSKLKIGNTPGTNPTLSFTSSDVYNDTLLNSLGNVPSAFRFATVSSSPQYNFVLVNTFLSPTGTQLQKSDFVLVKVDNRLQKLMPDVQFGGDGDDTAAAVAELPDGHIMVLGTFQLGNPPSQFKIALMKLNAQGKLQE